MAKMYKDKNGYWRYADTGMLVHRNVAENKIGRELRDDEVVHHKDGDKSNFRRKNLRVTSRSHHSKLHKRYDY
jgi:hypothetical protein